MRGLIFVLLLLPQMALAATIAGTVYDLDLNQVQAIVSITTQPEQRMVAKDGMYSFNVPDGEYTIVANATIGGEPWMMEENITVTGAGEYTLDLILSPSFDAIDSFGIEDPDLPVLTTETTGASIPWLPLLITIVGAGFAAWLVRRQRPDRVIQKVMQEDEYKTAVLEALKRHKGRITQRDLRKEVPFSEAKVSLVITELEADGKVQKIKKGRGNVLVLK